MNNNRQILRENYDPVNDESLSWDIAALGELMYAYTRLLSSDGVPENANWVGYYLQKQADELAKRAEMVHTAFRDTLHKGGQK